MDVRIDAKLCAIEPGAERIEDKNMIGNIVGYCTVSQTPSDKTRFLFGDISEIAGKELPVLERNFRGDCLCLFDNKGLVDVEHIDVTKFRPAATNPILDLVSRIMNGSNTKHDRPL